MQAEIRRLAQAIIGTYLDKGLLLMGVQPSFTILSPQVYRFIYPSPEGMTAQTWIRHCADCRFNYKHDIASQVLGAPHSETKAFFVFRWN
jgi:hypothetical protein